MDEKNQSAGRSRNDAQPLGERAGLVSNKQTKKTGRAEQRSAGPDGPDARETTKGIKPN
jgi:hypothetical protein